ncbi:Holliday junction branch migration protein RuvA [Oceanomicrobium pacificus]|uniref:Holliday junction branch migration complex subunit RuvA n=1 Tax=Oceanomicrobium pacificus TaxID=2692916 RepID=A0A6B0TRH9_9RHOB|nr:Holliday junction branch migration protein RuvA [Oceanomicrobium pacificus]MXU65309.1 Holliday junction branch migration protein RuvA [Oceanomicrobium pacificus]
MIGKVSGRIDHRGADHVLIDTGGVGYIVYCSSRTLAQLPDVGGTAALYTELVVREDLLQLYGFPTLAEREWHLLLTSVQGVGAKAALSVLGTLGTDGVSRAITLGDATAIKAAPGVGPKIASRVVLELKDKAPAVMALGAAGARRASGAAPVAVIDTGDTVADAPDGAPSGGPDAAGAGAAAQADALSALLNLGYGQGEAAAAVAEAAGAASEDAADAADLIRAALKLLAPKG